MRVIQIKEARSLYGKIAEGSESDREVSTLPSCICRGTCICNATSSTRPELYKLDIRKIKDGKRVNPYNGHS